MRKKAVIAPGAAAKGLQPLPADKNFVASLQKGLEVLTCFGRQQSRLTVSEAARLTHSTPASARRALLTLQTLGYLDSDGKRFWMPPRGIALDQDRHDGADREHEREYDITGSLHARIAGERSAPRWRSIAPDGSTATTDR